MIKGFKDEKAVWNYQRQHLPPTFDRYELVMPAGHPDVKGSAYGKIIYIENKVGDANKGERLLEPSQKKYIRWLLQCNQEVWLCVGSKTEKKLTWGRCLIYDGDNRLVACMGATDRPVFWSPTRLRSR